MQRIDRHFSFWSLLDDPLHQLPQIVFTLRAVQYPASMPVSLASLHLIQDATQTFVSNLYELLHSTSSVSEQLGKVRKLYEAGNIPNKIQDGTVPFPEDTAQIKSGIALEFRYVLLILAASGARRSWIPLAGMSRSSTLERRSTLCAISHFHWLPGSSAYVERRSDV